MSEKEAEASRWWYCYSVTVHTVYTALAFDYFLLKTWWEPGIVDCRESLSLFHLLLDWSGTGGLWLFGVWGSVWLVFHRPWPFLLISLSNNDNSSTAQWLPTVVMTRRSLVQKNTCVYLPFPLRRRCSLPGFHQGLLSYLCAFWSYGFVGWFCLNFVWTLWPCCMFLVNVWWCITSFGVYGHSVFDTFVQLTEGRSARDISKQPLAKKKLVALYLDVECRPYKINLQPA